MKLSITIEKTFTKAQRLLIIRNKRFTLAESVSEGSADEKRQQDNQMDATSNPQKLQSKYQSDEVEVYNFYQSGPIP